MLLGGEDRRLWGVGERVDGVQPAQCIADSQPKNTPELRAWRWKGQMVGFLFSILVKTQPPRCAFGCQFH